MSARTKMATALRQTRQVATNQLWSRRLIFIEEKIVDTILTPGTTIYWEHRFYIERTYVRRLLPVARE
jgi:hypothetical protein